MRLLVHTTRYAALSLLLTVGLAYGFSNPHIEPTPPHVIHVRPATPVETLTHQLEQAYQMDQITAGQR